MADIIAEITAYLFVAWITILTCAIVAGVAHNLIDYLRGKR